MKKNDSEGKELQVLEYELSKQRASQRKDSVGLEIWKVTEQMRFLEMLRIYWPAP